MLAFLRCVAEAVAEVGVRGLADIVPGGDFVYAVAERTLEKWRDRKRVKQDHEEFLELANATFDQARAEAARVTRELIAAVPAGAADPPTPEQAADLEKYLAGIPTAVRQSLKRPEDPAGTTVPAAFALNSADDVVRLLPARAPRFRPGDPLAGKPGWTLDRLLGTGGFGEVWFARHARMASLSGAVKFCFGQVGRDLIHEADVIDRVMAAGRHPNIVPLLDAHLDGDAPWLMFEYVAGGDLTDWIHSLAGRPAEKRLPQVVAGLRQLTDAVASFHGLPEPIVHRDLKPSNILLDKATRKLRVTDFGIGGVTARETNRVESRGQSSRGGRLLSYLRGSHTPLYSSPQQRRGDPPDPRDDVHALGVIAYQMLTGRLDSGPGTGAKRLLERCGASAELTDLVLICASEELEDRPATAKAIRLPVTEKAAVASSPSPEPATPAPERVLPPPPTEQTEWDIPVRGSWYAASPAGVAKNEWTGICNTPARVKCEPGLCYRLIVRMDFDNSALAGLSHLADLAQLTNLDFDIESSKQLTDEGLEHITRLTKLTSLSLHGCEQLKGLGHLYRLNRLTSLDLDGCKSLSIDELGCVTQLTRLTHLSLSGWKYGTEADLVHLAPLTRLTHLTLGDLRPLKGAGLAHLGPLKRLTNLSLGGCTFLMDEGLAHLARLPRLTDLSLCACDRLTDAGVAHLARLPRLTNLDLFGCDRLTGTGLAHLARLSQLTKLSLPRCKGVSQTAVERLQRALPNCSVEWK
ncbi:MAG: protein kinase [Gemmataceae bacterium]